MVHDNSSNVTSSNRTLSWKLQCVNCYSLSNILLNPRSKILLTAATFGRKAITSVFRLIVTHNRQTQLSTYNVLSIFPSMKACFGLLSIQSSWIDSMGLITVFLWNVKRMMSLSQGKFSCKVLSFSYQFTSCLWQYMHEIWEHSRVHPWIHTIYGRHIHWCILL